MGEAQPGRLSADDPCAASAVALAAAIRVRQLSPVDAVRAVLDRLDRVNPLVNAVVTIARDQALAAAADAEAAVMRGDELGPLHGVPFTVKDTTDTAGVRTTMGSLLLADRVPQADAVLVERLKRAGAILVGKTNTPEFACKAITDNLLFGVTRNPWKLDRTSGGSSGGAAAAVAAGIGPIATGNDAGGSIRIPASCCGVVGLKPQFGRVPSWPYFEHWETLSHEGPIARTVADVALMLDVMAGPHGGDRFSLPKPGVRYLDAVVPDVRGMAVCASVDLGYARVGRDVRGAFENARTTLVELGAHVEDANPELGSAESIAITLINAELAAMLERYGERAEVPGAVHPLLRARVNAARGMTSDTYLQACFRRRELGARIGAFLDRFDVLVCPTLGLGAWPVDAPGGYASTIDGEPVKGLAWSLCHPFNLSGHPAITMPWGADRDGLPIGLQIVGRAGDEPSVLRVAAALEAARPAAPQWPDFHS